MVKKYLFNAEKPFINDVLEIKKRKNHLLMVEGLFKELEGE